MLTNLLNMDVSSGPAFALGARLVLSILSAIVVKKNFGCVKLNLFVKLINIILI